MRPWCVAAILAALLAGQHPSAQSTPPRVGMERIRTLNLVRIAYRIDAPPFAFRDTAGAATGYAVAICQRIVETIKREPGLGTVSVDWMPVTAGDRFEAIEQKGAELLCGATTMTLERRTRMSFSIPIFPGGVGAVIRSDADPNLQLVLSGQAQAAHTVWRDAALRALDGKSYAAVQGTTAEKWLAQRIQALSVRAQAVPVGGHDAGVQALVDRKAAAFFGERAVLLDAVKRSRYAHELAAVDVMFTYEPLALAVPRGAEELRLIADRTISRLYASGEINSIYGQWFGAPDPAAQAFFRWNIVPEDD